MTDYTDESAEQRKALKKDRDRLRRDALHRDEAVRQLYKTFKGRTYLWSILARTVVMQNSFRPDPYQTSFLCGQQNTGQQLMAHMIEVDAAAFTAMMKEMNDAARDRRPDSNASAGGTDYTGPYGGGTDGDEPSGAAGLPKEYT